jgi:hypothetical protein
MLSHLFPPAGGVAVQRALSPATYLPACGFDAHVLRARYPDQGSHKFAFIPNGYDPAKIPAAPAAKLFECLASGEVARLLQETATGWRAAPEDHAGLRRLSDQS